MSTLDTKDSRLQSIAASAREAAARNGVMVNQVEFRRDVASWRHLVIVNGKWTHDHDKPATATLSVNEEALEDYGTDWCVEQIMEMMPTLFQAERPMEGRLIPGKPALCHG